MNRRFDASLTPKNGRNNGLVHSEKSLESQSTGSLRHPSLNMPVLLITPVCAGGKEGLSQ